MLPECTRWQGRETLTRQWVVVKTGRERNSDTGLESKIFPGVIQWTQRQEYGGRDNEIDVLKKSGKAAGGHPTLDWDFCAEDQNGNRIYLIRMCA